MSREQIIEFLRRYIPERYWQSFWLFLPCTVIACPLIWIFLYCVQYINSDFYIVRIIQLSILCSFVYGVFIGVSVLFLVSKAELSSKLTSIIMILGSIATIFCPLAFAIAGLIANS